MARAPNRPKNHLLIGGRSDQRVHAVANAPLQIRVRGETYHRAQVSCMGKNHYVYCSEKIWPHDPAKVLLDWYHGEAIDKYERKD